MQPAQRLQQAAPLLLALLCLAVLIAPTLPPDVQLFFRDTGELYYPVKRYIAGRVAHGQLPLWYPWSEAGTSLLGQVTPGLFHPFTLLYAALPFDLAFKLNHLLALPMAAAGIYFFARRLGASPWAASVGAIAYGGSGYLLSMASSNLPFALGAATAPWSLFGLLWFVERPSARRLLLASALLSLCAFAGDPQWMLLAGVIGSAWVIASAAVRGPAAAGRGLLLAGLWCVTALLLSAPASIPAAVRLTQTSRYRKGFARETDRYSTHPRRLFGLFVPVAFDDGGDLPVDLKHDGHTQFDEMMPSTDGVAFSASITFGTPAALLALLAARRRRGRFFLLAALPFALAATGSACGLHELLLRLPGFRYFRFAEKYIGPATLLLSVAAALGTDVALSGGKRAAAWLFGLAGGAAALLLGAALIGQARLGALTAWLATQGATHSPWLAELFAASLLTGLRLAGAFAVALALLGLLHWVRQRSSSAALAAMACAASTLVAAHDALPTAPIEVLHGPFTLADELTRIAGPSEGHWRVYTRAAPVQVLPSSSLQLSLETAASQALIPQYEVVAGIEGITPYFSAADDEYIEALNRFPSRIFRALSVRFALLNYRDMSGPLARDKGFIRFGHGSWLKDFGPGPRAWLVDGAQALPGPQTRAHLADSKFDVFRTALLPESSAAIARALSPQGSADAGLVREKDATPERKEFAVDARRAALLVISTHFDAGWRARVDGQSVTPVRVDLSVLGVPVPQGAHRVELRFVPQGLSAGIWLFAAALAGLAALAYRERRR